MAKPLVTANQVTLARLVLLPIGSWLVYEHPLGALLFLTLLGCTDFVDGWLARRYGPTVLGGLMDPIADKVFIVAVFVPYVDLGWLPGWLVALLLLREFLITGLRSVYERRGLSLRSTRLAQIKTWVQMVGAGTLFLVGFASRPLMLGIFGTGAGLPVLLFALFYLLRGRRWTGALIFSAWYGGMFLLYWLLGQRATQEGIMLAILVFTWISAWDYLARSVRLLPTFSAGDWVRVLSGVALPLLIFAAQRVLGPPSLLVILTLSLEMAVGGLDNLLSHHHAETTALAWGARVGAVLLCYALAIAVPGPGWRTLLAAAGFLASLGGTVAEFLRGRNYYLDSRLQQKPI